HWRGELSVAKSYWLSGLLRGLFVMIPVTVVCDYFGSEAAQMSLWDFLLENGWFGYTKVHIPALLWLRLLPAIPTYIWWAMGTWRSCNKYNLKNANKSARWLAKITIVVGYLGILSN